MTTVAHRACDTVTTLRFAWLLALFPHIFPDPDPDGCIATVARSDVVFVVVLVVAVVVESRQGLLII